MAGGWWLGSRTTIVSDRLHGDKGKTEELMIRHSKIGSEISVD